MDRSKILDNYRKLKKAMPRFRIAYAIKSNTHFEIIQLLHNEGAHFETASFPEIKLLLNQGIPGEEILLSNPIKTVETIQTALKQNVSILAFDSIDELEKFIPHKDKSQLMFRIKVPNEASLWPLTGKFGSPIEWWPDIFEAMQKNKIPLAGITFHPGSQCENITGWENAMILAWRAIQMSMDYGLSPYMVNIGGGFPIDLGREIPSIDEIGATVNSHVDEWARAGFTPKELFCEPGRFISGSAGYLVSKVVGTAHRDKVWAYLDCGVFNGLMETIDGIRYPLLTNGKSNELENVNLCGPSCDSVDNMFEAEIPAPKTGDKVILKGAGAYTSVYASNFNGFIGPQVHFVESVKDPKDLFDLVS